MKTLITAAGLALAAALPAHADTLTLAAPMQGGTLQGSTVDMSVYWIPSGDAAEVVAYYVPRAGTEDPARLQMTLADGDRTSFGLPGEHGTAYTFARAGGTVTVTSTATRFVLAQN